MYIFICLGIGEAYFYKALFSTTEKMQTNKYSICDIHLFLLNVSMKIWEVHSQ